MKPPPTRVIHDSAGLNTAGWPIPAAQFLTPVESFFTRSHASVPAIDPGTWRLQIDGLVDHPRRFSLPELIGTFPRGKITATLVCAGLRRDEFLSLGPLPGELPWGPEPIGTGEWSGVALGDVLRSVGVRDGARYLEFTGLDQVERQGERFGFGGSIDLDKALSGNVLLATELNGAPLPPAHGFPLRAVVPGWIGARSVKWLGRITLRDDPSPSYFQSQAYRSQRQVNPENPRDVSAGVALSEVPLNAVILGPTQGQVVPTGRLRVQGWAIGAGGRPVTAVELSANGGREWSPARITTAGKPGTWSLWERLLELGPGAHSLTVRAFDGTRATQPSEVRETWNVKGYCNNAWHRVALRAE